MIGDPVEQVPPPAIRVPGGRVIVRAATPRPLRYDLEIEQGATFRKRFTLREASGEATPLEGVTARAQIRLDHGGPLVLALETEIDPQLGRVTISAPAESTAALPWGSLFIWDLKLTRGAAVARLIEGRAGVLREATR